LEPYSDGFQITRILFQRSLAGIYLIAFGVALNQFPALLGEKGLLCRQPEKISFRYCSSATDRR
jgi:hypothetical protein